MYNFSTFWFHLLILFRFLRDFILLSLIQRVFLSLLWDREGMGRAPYSQKSCPTIWLQTLFPTVVCMKGLTTSVICVSPLPPNSTLQLCLLK